MNFNKLLLQDFHNAAVFDMYAMIFFTALVGALLFLMFALIFKWDIGEHYRQGQIDALNGKIKFEKRENDDKEIVWKDMDSNEK